MEKTRIKHIFLTILMLYIPLFGFYSFPDSKYNDFPVSTVDDSDGILLYLDWTLEDSVALMNTPGRDVSGYLKYQHNDPDEVTMIRITKVTDSMYYVTAFSGQTDTLFGSGWIRKNAALGIFHRVYTDNDSLTLFASPNDTSDILCVLRPEQLGDKPFLDVLNVELTNGWVEVSIVCGKEHYSGWISPQSQCPNPYTTCE